MQGQGRRSVFLWHAVGLIVLVSLIFIGAMYFMNSYGGIELEFYEKIAVWTNEDSFETEGFTLSGARICPPEDCLVNESESPAIWFDCDNGLYVAAPLDSETMILKRLTLNVYVEFY